MELSLLPTALSGSHASLIPAISFVEKLITTTTAHSCSVVESKKNNCLHSHKNQVKEI